MYPKVEIHLPALPKQVGEEPERHVWCPYSLDFQMKMGRALLGLLHPFLPHPTSLWMCGAGWLLIGSSVGEWQEQDQSRVQQEEWVI